MGQSPPSSTYNTEGRGLPFFQGKAEFTDLYPDVRLWCSEPSKIAPSGSILLSIRAPVGPTNLANTDCCIGRGLAALTPKRGINPRYVLYGLRRFAHELDALGTGTTFKAVSGQTVRHFTIPTAPTDEQARIVAKIEELFSDLDAGVAALERAKANLTRYRAAVLKSAVEGKLTAEWRKNHPDVEPASKLLERILTDRRKKWEEAEQAKYRATGKTLPKERIEKYRDLPSLVLGKLPDLPPGWVWTSVDMVGDVLLGRQRAPQYLTGKFMHPYLRVANIKDDRIDLSDIEEMDFDPVHLSKYRLLSGDILVSEGQSPELLGQSAIYTGGIENLCFQKTLHRFRSVPNGPSPQFAQLVFRAHVRNGIFRRLGSITTNIAHLTLEKFRASPFPLPPAREQEEICREAARILTSIDDMENQLRKQFSRAQQLRHSILKHAFEGKLVPQDPGDEPAHRLLEQIRTERAVDRSGKHKVPSRKRAEKERV
jgi:type I restriction enzyme S subunit